MTAPATAGWAPPPAWLFCPADRPDRFAKAFAAANVVILDLEDAVAVDRKTAARDAIRGQVAAGAVDVARTVVRVNRVGSADHLDDLALCAETGLRRVMLAKTEGAVALSGEAGSGADSDWEVVALVETARGVQRVDQIVASPQVAGVLWGADDLIASLGGTASRRGDGRYRDVVLHARSRVLLAAKAAGRFALDAVFMDIANLEALRDECEDAVASGFDGTVAIHPSQVPVIVEAYRPSAERVAWADGLLAAAGAGGVTTFRGQMVDGPIVRQAQRILRLAEAQEFTP